MPVNIKQLTINTKVNKNSNIPEEKAPSKGGGGGLSKSDKDAIIAECLAKVKEMIEYELKP